jgi:prephenate dehydrogenase
MAARSGGAEVIGFDPDPAVLDGALARGSIDAAAGSVAEAVGGAAPGGAAAPGGPAAPGAPGRPADAVFACAPVGALPALVEDALAAAGPDTVVTDVGSTKRLIASHVSDERFVGGHPIAGSESAGVEHARADLFQGAAWYLTPSARSSGVLYERLHGLLVSFGARPVALDPDSHDRLLATVSHLPHVLANVLVTQAARTVDREDEPLPRVGPSFRDATRVAGANSGIWTDIYIQNAAAIADEVDATVERLSAVAASLRAGDAGAVRDWNERARDDRRRLLEADIAGGPVHELRVTVDNRPGVVAELAVALGRGGVNIVDMRLAPAPDNLTGAITFWVAGDESAKRAAQLMEGLGFPVMEQG